MPEQTDHLTDEARAHLESAERNRVDPDPDGQAAAAELARGLAAGDDLEARQHLEALEAAKSTLGTGTDAMGALDPDDDPVGALEGGSRRPLEALPTIPPPPPPTGAPGLLERNGFALVRGQALGILQNLGELPPEALDAATEFNANAIARLRVDTHPQAAQALETAEAEARYLDAVRRFRRDLAELEQRLAARARLKT